MEKIMTPFEISTDTFIFQPVGIELKQIATAEEWTRQSLFEIARIRDDTCREASETRRRIALQLDQIRDSDFFTEGAQKRFCFAAEALVELTAYVDAMPKFRLGYRYMEFLDREAHLLIPRPVYDPIDVNECLVAFIRWRRNALEFDCPLLIVGLFLLFFYNLKYYGRGVATYRYDLLIEAIMNSYESDLMPEVKKIIQGGLYGNAFIN